MSYCPLPLWISPYNYLRAFNGRILGWARDAAESSTLSDAQKLLIAFRLHRDQSVDLDWALHLPGEARAPSGKGRSDLFLELQDRNGVVLASLNCSRPADRAHTAPYEDFQEVLPWYDSASDVVVVCDQVELARWKIEDPVEQPLVGKPKVTETRQDDGTTAVKISWKAQAGAQTKPHLMLRYTPDDGRTWIPLANGINGSEVDVPQELLDGVESVRFQLAVSAGIRTTLVDVPDAVVGIGTILNADDLARAEALGAKFGISPGATPELLKVAAASRLPFAPGIATASDLMQALAHGFGLVKFFPAEQAGGIKALRALAGPFPNIRVCPTGGIGEANAASWLAEPNVLAVGGSWLCPAADIRSGNWAGISAMCARAMKSLKPA
jgi:2-dehydro-3-deoxyphosphogluconate aldolase/(4S)-4-hydroxy-2-oxoglutarate aldolase